MGSGGRDTADLVRLAVYQFGATLRRRWPGYLAIALLVGLVGGVALASLSAARRTYASYPTFLAATNPSDLFVLPQTSGPEPGLVSWMARLPGVRSAEEGEQITAATLTPGGRVKPSSKRRSSSSPARTDCSPTRTG